MKKQNFRKYLSLLLATLTLAAALAGCAPKLMQDSVPPTPTPTPTAAPEEFNVEEFLARIEEVQQVIDDYAEELAAEYEFQGYKRDPWVNWWKAEGYKKQLRVKVQRQADVERAKELLSEYSDIQVVYDEPEDKPMHSRFNHISADPNGTLELRPFEHDIPGVPAQGFWKATLTWNGEPFEYHDSESLGIEVYDKTYERWYQLPSNYGHAGLFNTYTMETGEQWEWIITTAGYWYDFPPGQYRYIYGIDIGYYDGEAHFVFFIGEFEITEENAA